MRNWLKLPLGIFTKNEHTFVTVCEYDMDATWNVHTGKEIKKLLLLNSKPETPLGFITSLKTCPGDKTFQKREPSQKK